MFENIKRLWWSSFSIVVLCIMNHKLAHFNLLTLKHFFITCSCHYLSDDTCIMWAGHVILIEYWFGYHVFRYIVSCSARPLLIGKILSGDISPFLGMEVQNIGRVQLLCNYFKMSWNTEKGNMLDQVYLSSEDCLFSVITLSLRYFGLNM